MGEPSYKIILLIKDTINMSIELLISLQINNRI